MYRPLTSFSEQDINDTKPAMKIGLLATVTPKGLPHLTLMSSLMAYSEKGICFGQFTEGLSKQYILDNPKVGFLIMSMNKEVWRGKATFTYKKKDGPEFDYFNNVPMFRYNAYFGVHTVYYLDLVHQSGKSDLPMNKVIFAAIQTMIARNIGKKPGKREVINKWTQAFFNKLDNLKFLSYVHADGHPVIIPVIQAQSLDKEHIIFSTSVYQAELEKIPSGVDMCILDMALSMEDVLVRGKYLGAKRIGGINAGIMQVDWVYNPMPPVPGQIYPPVEIKEIQSF